MSGSGCASFCSVFQTLKHSAAPWTSSGALICFSKSGFAVLWDGMAVPIRATLVYLKSEPVPSPSPLPPPFSLPRSIFHSDCPRGVVLTRCSVNWFSFEAVSMSGEMRLWKPGGAHPFDEMTSFPWGSWIKMGFSLYCISGECVFCQLRERESDLQLPAQAYCSSSLCLSRIEIKLLSPSVIFCVYSSAPCALWKVTPSKEPVR